MKLGTIKTIHYVSTDDCVNEKMAYGEYVVIPRLGEIEGVLNSKVREIKVKSNVKSS